MGYPTTSISAPGLLHRRLGLFAAHHRPALELGDRPVLLDPDGVADLEFVVLVMRVILLGAPDDLAEDRVGEAALDPHHQSLVLLVADHDALQAALGHLCS